MKIFMKKNLLFIAAIFFFSITFSLSSCKKDDIKTGLSEDIQNLVPDSLLQTIKDLGMHVNEGLTPPDIENIYLGSPFELVSSNIDGDTPGHLFADFRVRFSDQNNDDLTVKVSYTNGSEEGKSLGSFVSGNGNDFSVFVKMTSTSLDTEADLLLIISGTKVTEGIKDLYYSIFMLNNYGNANDYWIENGKGRVIYDSDGISPIVESLYSLKTDNQLMFSDQSAGNALLK
jgi:hypothetical protein